MCLCVWFASRAHSEAVKVAELEKAQTRTDKTDRHIATSDAGSETNGVREGQQHHNVSLGLLLV